MSYAIIGFGNIGQALAKAFARKGMEVSVATTRAPDSFAATTCRSTAPRRSGGNWLVRGRRRPGAPSKD